jgi:hypothetical protein
MKDEVEVDRARRVLLGAATIRTRRPSSSSALATFRSESMLEPTAMKARTLTCAG